MAVAVIPPLSLQQQIIETWNGLGVAINGFIGLVAAAIGISGIMAGWFLKKSKLNKDFEK